MAIENAKFKITAENATAAAFRSVKNSLSDVQGAAMSVKSALMGLATTGVIAGLVMSAKSALDTADNLNKMSQKIGISVESLSTLKYAAELSDVSLEGLGQAIKKLSQGMQDTEANVGESRLAFHALQITVKDGVGGLRATEDVILDIADKFARMEDGASKTAFAVKLFGRSGIEMIPFLNQGRDGIRALTKEAEKLGLKLSGDAARGAEEFNDNLKAVQSALAGAWREMMTKMLPGLVEITQAMREGAKEGGVLTGVLEGLRTGFAKLFFDDTANKLRKVNEQIVLVTDKIKLLESHPFSALLGTKITRAYKSLQDLYRQQGELEQLGDFDKPNAPKSPPKIKAPPLPDEIAIKAAKKAEQDAAAERKRMIEAGIKSDQESLKARFDAYEDVDIAISQLNKKQILDREEMLEKSRKDDIEAWDKYLAELEEHRVAAAQMGLRNRLKAQQEESERTERFARELGLTFTSAFEDAVVAGKQLQDVLKGLGADIAKIIMRKTITEPFGASLSNWAKGFDFGGLLGFGKSASQMIDPWAKGFDFGGLEGMASGGSFTVGGSGGTDSQLVRFRATPGEKVSVQTPQQQGGGIHIYPDLRGASVEAVDALYKMVRGLNASVETRALNVMRQANVRGA